MADERIPPRPDAFDRTTEPVAPSGSTGVAERPRASWSWWEGLLVYVVAFILAGLATLPILSALRGDDALGDIASTAVAAIVIVAALVAWLSNSHPGWISIVGLPERGAWWREIRASVGFGLVLYPLMVFVVGVIVALVLQAVSGRAVDAPEQVPSHLSAVGVVVTTLYAVVIAPIHEELFFRGILYRGVRDRYGLVAGLIATGVGFGLIHYLDGPWQGAVLLMGVMFVNGMALAWWYERRGTIVSPIVAHMVFNVIGLALIFGTR
jgi:membrane protease YdiL (CAAX protease family)